MGKTQMTEDDKDALKEFMRGVAFTVGLCAVAFLGIAVISRGDTPSVNESKVVGTYKECDIIQWHYDGLSEYKYFLHCPND